MLTIDDAQQMIKKEAHLAGFNVAEQGLLLSLARHEHRGLEEAVIDRGSCGGRRFMLVLEGELEVRRCDGTPSRELQRGTLFGEIGVLVPSAETCTMVISRSPSEILVWDMAQIESAEPDFANRLKHTLQDASFVQVT